MPEIREKNCIIDIFSKIEQNTVFFDTKMIISLGCKLDILIWFGFQGARKCDKNDFLSLVMTKNI